jgi:transposase
MSERGILSLKPDFRLEWRGQDRHDETQEPDHSASLGDSGASSTRITFSVHTAYIFGAVCPQRGATAALVVPTANTEVMSLHLAEIGRRVVPGSHAALVLDGAGYHVAKNLAVPHNITLVPLPPYAPELNPIENVWEYLRGNKLAITVFDSYDDILDKSCNAWTFFADDNDRITSITTRSWATVNR